MIKDKIVELAFTGKDGRMKRLWIERDEDAPNPRIEYDVLWTWSCTSGAGYSDKGAERLEYVDRPEFRKEHLVVPLSLYRHGSDWISAGMPETKDFDSGCMGFAYLSKQKALDAFQKDCMPKGVYAKAVAELEREVAEMNAWINGDFYGVIIADEELGDEEDACWNILIDARSGFERVLGEWLDEYMESPIDARKPLSRALQKEKLIQGAMERARF